MNRGPGRWNLGHSELHKDSEVKNGFALTTGINVSKIKYPKIIFRSIGRYEYVLPLYIVKVVTQFAYVLLKTMHSSRHFSLLVIDSKAHNWHECYTSRQCVRFSSRSVEIYVNFTSVPLCRFQKTSCPKDRMSHFLSNTFNCVLSLGINCNFKTKWQSWQPIFHLKFLNSLIRCLVVGCRRGRYRGTQECHKGASPKSSVVFGKWEELPKGHMGIGWGCSHQRKTVPLSESWGKTGFSQHRESG